MSIAVPVWILVSLWVVGVMAFSVWLGWWMKKDKVNIPLAVYAMFVIIVITVALASGVLG